MLGWALLINNVGRRRYPLHWWAAGQTFVRDAEEGHNEAIQQAEEGELQRELTEEGDLAVESDDTRSRLSETRSRLSEPISGPAENTAAPKENTHAE